MSIRITTLNHKTPPGIEPWRYQVTFPRIEGHEVDMENLQPTLDIEEPGVYDDDDHLTGEIDYSLQHIYDYCDYHRVLLSPTEF